MDEETMEKSNWSQQSGLRTFLGLEGNGQMPVD